MSMSITRDRITEYLQLVIKTLDEHGGNLPSKDVSMELEKKLNLTAEEKDTYAKTGSIKWIKIMHFHSIGLVKAGWIIKNKGIWYLTDEGKESLKLDAKTFKSELDRKYRKWLEARNLNPAIAVEYVVDGVIEEIRSRSFEQSQSDSREEIKEYIRKLNPYEFQELVAALFRGMGYYTPFIAPRGPDGGIDIVAYKDPIGAEFPRIRIQVKHRVDNSVSRAEVQSLSGNLHREGYVGVIVSSGGFSRDAIAEIRTSGKHMEKIDLDDFIDLWEGHYNKLSDEDKALLPLRKISFLAPEE